ncbi:MAG: VWA domain-containing protein [Candidatus Kapaibacterium sp.]|nr:MAG: VWA domain-containing protein [Candidatus Kapabacteria bacterium]
MLIAVCFIGESATNSASLLAQSLTVYDINASAFPLMRAKFFALDANGNPITDLAAQDFMVRENGTQRVVTTASCQPGLPTKSLSVVLTIDVSGSMGEGIANAGGVANLTLAQTAARAWINAMPEGEVECAITSYDHSNYLNQDFTHDRKRLLKAVNDLKPQGGTDYDMGLIKPVAGGLLVADNAKYSRKIVVFLTDGQGGGNEDEIVQMAKLGNVAIYCVTLGMPAPDNLRSIARRTGGEVFENVTSVPQAEQIYRILLQLALGNKPCELAWMSEKACNVSRMNTSIALLSRGVTTTLDYDIPPKSVTALEFSSENITFGAVDPRGGGRELKLVVKARNSAFTVTDITSSNEMFSISPTYFQLKSGQRKVLTVRYAPRDSGYAFTKFSITDNVCGGRTIFASGGFPGKTPNPGTLTLIEPNGGESYVAGADTTVQWSGIMPSEAVSADFSSDGGRTWQRLIPAVSGLRADWRVPNIQTNQAMMRLRQLQTPKLSNLKDYILNAAFTPDAKRIVTLGAGGVARGWDVQTGSARQLYFSNQYGQRKKTLLPGKIMVSPNGKHVVAGFQDGSARIWDAQSGDLLDVFLDHIEEIYSVRFSMDGSRVVTASADSTAKIWLAESAETLQSLRHTGQVFDAAFSPTDPSVAATVGADSLARIWDVKSGEEIFKLEHKEAVLSLAFSPDGTRLLTTSADGVARLWDPRKGTLLEKMSGHKGLVHIGLFSPDGGTIVTCSVDSTMRAWNGRTGEWKRFQLGGKTAVLTASFLDSLHIITGNDDRSLTVWNLETGALVQRVANHTGAVLDVRVSSDKRTLASVGAERKALFWSIDYNSSTRTDGTPVLVPLTWKNDTTAVQEVISAAPFSITAPLLTVRNVDMGRCLRGESKDSLLSALLRNNDGSPLKIEKIEFVGEQAEEFSIVSGGAPCVILPKGARNLELRFKPRGTGERRATMQIITQSDTIRANIVGSCSAPLLVLLTKTIDFEEVKIKQQKDTLVAVLKNVSLQPVVITNIAFTGPNTTDFRLVGNTAQVIKTDTSYILYPQSAISLRLRYKPTSAGRTSCQLKIAYNGLGSPITVQLFGTGGSTLSAYIQAYGVKPNPNPARRDSVEYPIESLRVEEFLANTMHPLLNYIFFEQNSATLPARYARLPKEQSRRYTDKSLFERQFSNQSTLEVYRNVLNVIGSRMRANPNASITLVGCKATKEKFNPNEQFLYAPKTFAFSTNASVSPSLSNQTSVRNTNANANVPATSVVSSSNASSSQASGQFTPQTAPATPRFTGDEESRLSEARTLAIKSYLVHVWGIAEDRIKTSFRGLPEKASSENTPDGIAENRRVEILASEPSITDVVVANDTLRAVIPPLVRFRTNALSDVSLTKWQMAVSQKSRRESQLLKEYIGTGKPQDRLQWNTATENNTAPKLTLPVQYSLNVQDESGASVLAGASLPVEVISIAKKRAAKTADKEVNTFGLLLFDFNKSEVSEQHQNILGIVKQRMNPSSRITIIGYTDRTGNAQTNKTLSLQRANTAATALQRTDAIIEGRGSEGLMHDNTTPEGRFYCRTVNILVENAVNNR